MIQNYVAKKEAADRSLAMIIGAIDLRFIIGNA
jgi:hypothetical protein